MHGPSKITKLEGEQIKIQAQVANVRKNAQSFVDNMIKIIEAKNQKFFEELEDQAKKSRERLKIKQCEIERELRRIETEIEKTETLVKRSTSAEIVQLNTTFLEGVGDEREELDCDFEDLGCLIFVENKALIAKASCEGIGSIETFSVKLKRINQVPKEKELVKRLLGLKHNLF